MGSGVSVYGARRKARRITNNIDKDLHKAHEIEKRIVKMLLLGAAESGKSTILKQMRIIHMGGFGENERSGQKMTVYRNCLLNMHRLLEAMKALGIEFEHPADRKKDAEVVYGLQRIPVTSDQSVEMAFNTASLSLEALWADSGIQEAYTLRNLFQLDDSTAYFFNCLDRISNPKYCPTTDDILRIRTKTTGIVEVEMMIKRRIFKIFDVGGQRSERKKWIHCFDNVNAVIFIAAMSVYDQVLLEDPTRNRMEESLELFQEISNNQYFTKSSIILFLNKKDLFTEKIKTSSVKNLFIDFEGDETDYEQVATFIEDKFDSLHFNEDKMLYIHQTCATDTDQVEFALRACIHTIISRNLTTTALY